MNRICSLIPSLIAHVPPLRIPLAILPNNFSYKALLLLGSRLLDTLDEKVASRLNKKNLLEENL